MGKYECTTKRVKRCFDYTINQYEKRWFKRLLPSKSPFLPYIFHNMGIPGRSTEKPLFFIVFSNPQKNFRIEFPFTQILERRLDMNHSFIICLIIYYTAKGQKELSHQYPSLCIRGGIFKIFHLGIFPRIWIDKRNYWRFEDAFSYCFRMISTNVSIPLV